MHQPGRRDPAAARDDRPRDVQRGLPHRRPRARRRRASAASTTAGRSPTRRCMFERSGIGAGGGAPVRGASMALPGTVAGQLEQRAGDFVAARPQRRQRERQLARNDRRAPRPTHRPGQAHGTQRRPDDPPGPRAPAHAERARAATTPSASRPRGRPAATSPASRNISKLSMSRHRAAAAATSACGSSAPHGMLHAYDDEGRKALDAAEPATRVAAIMVTEPGAVRPGAAHLRRHRPDPAQHHRRARARPPEGAGRPLVEAVLRAAEERLSALSVGSAAHDVRREQVDRPHQLGVGDVAHRELADEEVSAGALLERCDTLRDRGR